MTRASDTIKKLIGYTDNVYLNDAEERTILNLLRTDINFSRTIIDLDKGGYLDNLFDRIDPDDLRELVEVLGGKLPNATADSKLSREIRKREAMYLTSGGGVPLNGLWQSLYHISRNLQGNIKAHNLVFNAPPFSASAHSGGIGKKSSSPFSGSGATGVNPSTMSVGVRDSYRLWRGKKNYPNTWKKYSNPVGGLSAYLATLTPKQRRDQARVLIKLPISTVLAHSYIGWIPSRQRVIRAAGKQHDLEPQLVAAFLLAEQRDQSKLEDAKDFDAATSIKEANTSIGLGQIVVSTARRHDLFADLLAAGTRKALSHRQIAHLLSSDEFNIFGVARYIRKTADKASKLSRAALPRTTSIYPSINFSDFAKNSKHWPDDNVKALGSEYTSKAWDDKIFSHWADFVFEAYKDVKAAAVF